ncbi:MAG: hypothetical protein GQ535_12260 [Rhodobacteraceae bacterium]|nr:hypothetical protein [Paracoccaceae bacterium]
MQVEDIISRLIAQVSEFEGRVEGSAELAALVKTGRAPNRTPAAFVLPLGIVAQPADTVTGLYRQGFTESFGIVIVQTIANDKNGRKGLSKIHTLRDAVIANLAGWRVPGGFDVLALTRAKLQSLNAGTITYQVDFSTKDQLRILT